MTLEDRLERLATRTAPGDPADVLAAARRRAEAGNPRRTGGPRLLAAAAAVVLLAIAAGAMAVLGGDGGSADLATGRATTSSSAPASAGQRATDGPSVSVEAAGLPTVDISTSPLRESAAAESNGWLDHTITMKNAGSAPVYLNDFRSGTMLGDQEVLAATDGCGYGSSGNQPVSVGCRYDYRPVTIEPGGAHEFTVTLWRDLPGMNPVTAGKYRWDINLQIGDASFTDPGAPGGKVGTLTLRYDGFAESDAVHALPGWVPNGYRLAWVDTPAVSPSDADRFALHERPHDYAYGYQQPGAAELEVRVMLGASIDEPQAVADEWNRLAAPTTVGGRPAVGVTDEGRYTQLLVEVDGGVAMITTHPLGESYPDGPNPAMPSREDVDRFAASIAAVSDTDWDAALSSSGADVASTFGPKDGAAVVDGDGWSLTHGEFRAPLSVRHPALWVDFGEATGGAAGAGVLGENEAWHVAISMHDSTRVAWGILPAGTETVEVAIDGQVFSVETVALEETAEQAFAVDVSSSIGNGTFKATGATGNQVASGPIDTE
jgi:hypothetical protein